MVNEFIIGNYYNIQLGGSWSSLSYNCLVVGNTRKNAINNIEEGFSIFSTFFESLNLTLSTFFSMISNETDILIVNIANSLESEVPNVDPSNFFIPVSLIDYTNSNRLFPFVRYEISVGGIIRFFDNDNLRSEFENGIQSEIVRIFSGSNMFGSPEPINVGTTNVVNFESEEILIERELRRKAFISAQNQILIDTRLANERRERNIIDRESELRIELANTIIARDRFNDNTTKLKNLQDNVNDNIVIVNNAYNNLRATYENMRIFALENNIPNFPPWEDFFVT